MSSPQQTSPKGCKNQSSNNGITPVSDNQTQVQHITTELEFDALQADWEQLHSSSDQSGLFNSWYWNRLWWQHYGGMGELYIVAVRINGLVRAIAPLYRCKTKAIKLLSVSTLRFIGTGGNTSPDDLGVLYDQEAEDTVIDILCRSLYDNGAASRLQLYEIADDSRFTKALFAFADENRWCKPLTRYQRRHVDVLPASVVAFEKSLSRNARKHRKRRRQRLQQSGDVKFTTCTTVEDVRKSFDELRRLHTLRQQSKGDTGSFQSEQYCQFHLALMEAALLRNELLLTTLSIDGSTIGIEYAFLSNKVLLFFQTGFDPQYQHLSPGHLLMMQTIDQAIAKGATRIDLLKGDYIYKRTYAKLTTTTVNLDIWKNPIIAGISRMLRALRSLLD